MNFNSKETYLVAVAEWKAEYAELSQEIRNIRKSFNEAQKNFSKTSYGNTAAYWAAYKEMERLRSYRDGLRIKAGYMLGDRFNMKDEAQRQYLAAKT